MICPNCKTENSDTTKYCFECGTPLKSVESEINQQENNVKEKNSNASVNGVSTVTAVKKSNKKTVIIIIALVVLIVLGFIGYAIYNVLTGFDKEKAQTGYFEFIPDVSIGKLLNSTHLDVLWGEESIDSGYRVEFFGTNAYDDTTVTIRFEEGTEKNPKVVYLRINGEDKDVSELKGYINKVYAQYNGDYTDETQAATSVAATTAPKTTEVLQTTAVVTEIKSDIPDYNMIGATFDQLIYTLGEPDMVVPSPTPMEPHIAYKYGHIYYYSDVLYDDDLYTDSDCVTRIAVEEDGMLMSDTNIEDIELYADTYTPLLDGMSMAGVNRIAQGTIIIDDISLKFFVSEKSGNNNFSGNTLYEFYKNENTESSPSHMVDLAGITDSDQEISNRLISIGNNYDIDIVIVTVNSTDNKTATEYADDYYDSNGYYKNGILFLLNMGSREWAISTKGSGIDIFSNNDCDYIFNCMRDYLSNGNFDIAFNTFADECESILYEYEYS